MRILPVNENLQPTAAKLVEPSDPVKPTELERVKPLDLTLPPLLDEGFNLPLEIEKPLLPPLFGVAPKPEGITLGGGLITSETNTEFEFDLSKMLDQIEGAEIRIKILQ